MPTPEEQARQTIDALLAAAGWQVRDRNASNLGSAPGVIEAKPAGTTLSPADQGPILQ